MSNEIVRRPIALPAAKPSTNVTSIARAKGKTKAVTKQTQFERAKFREPGHGFVIKFSLSHSLYSGAMKTYEYAAMNVHGRWFTTGSTCPVNGFSWRELCAFVDRSTLVGTPAVWDGK